MKADQLRIYFDRNIAEYKDSIEFAEDDLAGVALVRKLPGKAGRQNILFKVNGPNYERDHG